MSIIYINHNYSDAFRLMRESEVRVNYWFQQNVKNWEPLLEFLSTQINVAFIIDYLLPIMAVISYPLMVLLASALSVSNVFTSTIKWVFHSSRPYWFVRQMESTQFNVTLEPHELVCETTSGFPSSHITVLTALLYIISLHMFNNVTNWRQTRLSLLITSLMIASTALMWISRIYFGDQFLHQCFMSGVGTIILLQYAETYAFYLLKRSYSILLVLALGFICVLAYSYMMLNDIDPFWSVRMGFKYCPDISFLKHTTSPVFVLARDFGFIMGVALSAPINLHCPKPTGRKRVLVLCILEVLNFLARYYRPTQSGRFLFVAAEFMRNLIHAFGLLQILSIIK